MSRSILAALVLAGLVACGDRGREDVGLADSLARDLELAPVDTTAELNDQPAPEAEPAPEPAPAPAPAARSRPRPAPAPAPKPAPAPAPTVTSRGLAAGTTIAATTT